jgi:hypothetical protein
MTINSPVANSVFFPALIVIVWRFSLPAKVGLPNAGDACAPADMYALIHKIVVKPGVQINSQLVVAALACFPWGIAGNKKPLAIRF